MHALSDVMCKERVANGHERTVRSAEVQLASASWYGGRVVVLGENHLKVSVLWLCFCVE